MILIIYLAKTLLCSAVFYGYYLISLRDKAFHQYNRFYILLTSALSLVLPLVRIPVNFSSQPGAFQFRKTLQAINTYGWEQEFIVTAHRSFFQEIIRVQNIYYWLYALCSIVVIIPVFRSLFAIQRMQRKYIAEKREHVDFYNTNEAGTPFSFFNAIFWNKDIQVESKAGQYIFRHELFHVHERHSLDLIWIEIIRSLSGSIRFFIL